MRTNSEIDFAAPHFANRELSIPEKVAIFDCDLPNFKNWAAEHGANLVLNISDESEYVADHYELVAHQFRLPILLSQIGLVETRIRTLLRNSQRLILYIVIQDKCTIEEVRRVLHAQMPDLTFRILFPRGLYRTASTKVILVEPRRPRIFLFIGGRTMIGKTETALSFKQVDAAIVHGDEYLSGICASQIKCSDDLQRRIVDIRRVPFDYSLFAEFVSLMPAFRKRQDIVFDFLLPDEIHANIMTYFEELGFFPILCLTSRLCLPEYKPEIVALRTEIAEIRKSTSWRITAPLRFGVDLLRLWGRRQGSGPIP